MNELIKIEQTNAGGLGIQTVDARELHAFLGVGRKFNAWIIGRIAEYGFAENVDFAKVRSQTGPNFKRLEVEYFLSLDMAKELAMVERSAKGREARQYFIEVEKKYRSAAGVEWSAAREQGKLVRKITTDIIQNFIEYARGQGSQSADKYFMNFTKMVNNALIEIDGEKPKNLRDALNVVQLTNLSTAETIINRSILECIGKQLPYKDIYQIAKKRIEVYAQSVGRSRLGQSERQTMGLLA